MTLQQVMVDRQVGRGENVDVLDKVSIVVVEHQNQ